MSVTLKELATLTQSTVKGDDTLPISGIATLQEAEPSQISFVSNPIYSQYLNDTKAGAVILNPKMAASYSGHALINDDPYLTFAKVVNVFHASTHSSTKIHPSAHISSNASIGKQAQIAANVVIEDKVKIGDNVSIGAGCVIGKHSVLADNITLQANVTLYADTHIGRSSIIHSGAIIGADGFGFALQADKSWYKILQIGNVVIGENVEIGASTTVDRAALGSTIISNGVKLDNQIQIGHNVFIDEHAIIAAGTLIAGSTSIGKRCQIGGAVAIAGHLTIVDDVVITGRSMVIKSLPEAGVYSSGIGADSNKKWKRNAIRFSQLDSMAKTLKHIEKQLNTKSES